MVLENDHVVEIKKNDWSNQSGRQSCQFWLRVNVSWSKKARAPAVWHLCAHLLKKRLETRQFNLGKGGKYFWELFELFTIKLTKTQS